MGRNGHLVRIETYSGNFRTLLVVCGEGPHSILQSKLQTLNRRSPPEVPWYYAKSGKLISCDSPDCVGVAISVDFSMFSIH